MMYGKRHVLIDRDTVNSGRAGIVMISNSGIDERGENRGGKAGDQTGGEWKTRPWYDRPWTCILRHPRDDVREAIATNAEKAALNDHIGYDQRERTTFYKQLKKVGWDPAKITTNCEADCSAGVIACSIAAGHQLGVSALQNLDLNGTTGTMRSIFRNAGFWVLTDHRFLESEDYLLRGDILLNDNHHTATCLTDGPKSRPGNAPAEAPAPVEKDE